MGVAGTKQTIGRGRANSEAALKSKMISALDGSAHCYNSLLRELAPLLRAFFGRRMRDDGGAVEDLVQEALIAVHTRRGTFDRTRPFTPWLFSIARHKLVDHLRRTRQHQPIDGLEDILATEGFEDASNAGMDVARLLAGLPEKQARAIRDTRILGLGVAEVAERAGMSVSDVKISVHRGLKTLVRRTEGCRA